ncbi:MAG: hypothetical protein AABY22_34145 [Nanoarchaeota archaeon]
METTSSAIPGTIPAPAGKPLYKQWWFWAIIALLILLAILFYRYKNRQKTSKITKEEMELAEKLKTMKKQFGKCMDEHPSKEGITDKHPCFAMKAELDKAAAELANKIP